MKALDFEGVRQRKQKLIDHKYKITILCDHLISQENVAHVFRLADALSISEVILYHHTPEIYSLDKINRLSRSTLDKIKYEIIHSLDEIKKGTYIALEWCDNSQSIYESIQLPKSFTLVIGNEKHGMSKEALDLCEQAIHIPMYGVNSSMNVAMATSIALYQLIHQ